jgi:multidrug efflux system outer membrane protein
MIATKTSSRLLVIVLAAAPLGCAVGPNFIRPDPHVPPQWSAAATTSSSLNTEPQAVVTWWTTFQEPTLVSLIERSTAANLDLRAAVLRITEARAERDVAGAAFWPKVDANASYTRQRLSDTTTTGAVFTNFGNVTIPGAPAINFPNPYNQFQLGAGASWEIDLFGRIRRSVEAANAELQASVEDQHAVLVSLCADVARNYIELRGAQLRRDVTQQTLATQGELYDLTRQARYYPCLDSAARTRSNAGHQPVEPADGPGAGHAAHRVGSGAACAAGSPGVADRAAVGPGEAPS